MLVLSYMCEFFILFFCLFIYFFCIIQLTKGILNPEQNNLSNEIKSIVIKPICPHHPSPPSPYQFFPCNFYKRWNQSPRLSDFQFEPFCHTGVKFEGHVELEPRASLKKNVFSGQLEAMITSLLVMLELPNFGHVTTSKM